MHPTAAVARDYTNPRSERDVRATPSPAHTNGTVRSLWDTDGHGAARSPAVAQSLPQDRVPQAAAPVRERSVSRDQ